MKAYHEGSFHGIPSNYPLKSPSPDMKPKNTLVQTLSPHSNHLKTFFNGYTPSPNKPHNQNYSEYSTSPHFQQQIGQNPQTKIQMMFSNTKNYTNERQYSSTHAKGSYDFQIPQQYRNYQAENNKSDFITTGKKITYQSHINQPSTPSNRKNNEFLKVIEEKDMIISQLKDMINLMTQNGKHLKISQKVYHEQEYERMDNEVRILTIENQKLSQVIDKLKQKNENLVRTRQVQFGKNKKEPQKGQFADDHPFQHTQIGLQLKFREYQDEVNNLKQILSQKETDHRRQIEQLKKLNETITLEGRFFENQKQRFSKQNQRLINLLKLKDKEKQTCYNNYSYFDKSQYESSIQNSNHPSTKAYELKNSNDPGSGRLSIQKIKAQYEQNLRLYKQNVYNEVYQMFDTINLTLEEINEKINILEQKIVDMEGFRDSWKQRVRSHLTSVDYNEEQIKKSAIYIQQAPSSERMSSSEKSKHALSIILQESRRDNEKLELQLSQLRRQVGHYKDTLQERLLINGSQSQMQISESYQKRIKQLENFLDQLRQQKQTIQNQLTDVKHQLEKTQKEKADQRSLQEQRLFQIINNMQNNENLRQKQLLSEIQRFQSLIKETQEQFKSTKQEHQNQLKALHDQIQFHKAQKDNIEAEYHLLRTANEELKVKSLNLETARLNNLSIQQNIQKIQSLVQGFKKTQGQPNPLTQVSSYIQNLQVEIINRNRQKSQLIELISNKKEEIMHLQHAKVELTQRVRCLQEKFKLSQLQLEKNKQFYSKFINNENQLAISHHGELHTKRFTSKNPKFNAKSKIDDLLNSQQKKINQLIDSISNLTKNQQHSSYQQLY